MESTRQKFPFRTVVLVADLFHENTTVPTHLRRDLEMTHRTTREAIERAILSLGLTVKHYDHPQALAARASQHLEDVVLSVFGGAISRNRLALVPAICETFGLAYVGPDVYASIICQNKEISKAIACEAGLKVPSHRIVRHESDIARVRDFPLPYVVKPLWEGSSIGIGPENLIQTREQGQTVIQSLLNYFEQPLLIEAFVPGREVSWCFMNGPSDYRSRSFAEIIWNDDPNHFYKNLYDASHKSQDEKRTFRLIIEELNASDSCAMERLLQFIGSVPYGRIDGKLENGRLIFLEITPDAWLDPTGIFASSFRKRGLSFDELIARLLLSAKRGLQDRSANGSNTRDDI